MKQISIIIPTNNGNKTPHLFGSSITRSLAFLFRAVVLFGIDYEIVIVADSQRNITLRDIEIFPKCTPIKLFKEKEQKNISELSIRGVNLAKYDTIGILGSNIDYLPQILVRLLHEGGDAQVVAALKTKKFSLLPFFLKLIIRPQNAAIFFPKAVWDVISFQPQNDTVFLTEFVKRSQEAGFSYKKYHLTGISASTHGHSRISLKELLSAIFNFLSVRLKSKAPIYIPEEKGRPMMNAGLFYKKRKYVTHTTLNIYHSALSAITIWSLYFFVEIIIIMGLLFYINPMVFIQTFIAVLSCIYLLDVCFNLFLVFKSFYDSPELSFSKQVLSKIKDSSLPVYSILCPLYKEAHMLPQFIEGLEKLDWPKDKLDVIILLESDDLDSINAFKSMQKPRYMRSVIVPNSVPKTKPKACNFGLAFAKGTFTVIFDAEDIPDPMQLKKAYLGFKKSGSNVACIQAKLSYYNSTQNLLTRFFTAEYSLWFDITLTSLYSLHTIIPLGGTSNHFRTSVLRKLHAWDPFNVTEDADLGLRLFRIGYHTAILDSVTLEEGNSDLGNWIRQRSRWIKGYMQTYLVHTKENISFFRERGLHAFIFHLLIGGKIAFIIINPFLWIVTLLYFTLYSLIGPTIDSFYPPFVLYVAITSLIFGNSIYLFCHLMGCVKKGQWSLIKYVYLIPFYWILISIAGFLALYQLLFKPFYWEKTVHGLHLKDTMPLNSAVTQG